MKSSEKKFCVAIAACLFAGFLAMYLCYLKAGRSGYESLWLASRNYGIIAVVVLLVIAVFLVFGLLKPLLLGKRISNVQRRP